DIHTSRKNFKKLRGVIRAVRPALGELVYKRENAFFRDVGRELSGYRESFVQVKTLDFMVKEFPNQLDTSGVTELRERLKADHADRMEKLRAGDRTHSIAARLARTTEEIADWPLQRNHALVLDGITATYRRGRKEYRQARNEPTTERLHSWRKRVKYHWYQVRMIKAAWPELLAPLDDAVHSLADDLGDDHDYADFEARVIDGGEIKLSPKMIRKLHKAMAARRDALQTSAFGAARRIYAEEPAHFARRLGAYLEFTWA
ncbi:MAG: CHAD domain-containing protein, partial [Xanthomonadales bacterium]|nr:CHAD domain-containing protein [Xanthomonadales bacterium]